MDGGLGKGQVRRTARGYRLARALITPVFAWLYNYKRPKLPPLPAPYLLIPNHSTDLDFLLTMHSFDQPMDFVVGESLLRSPVLRFLFTRFHSPIVIHKGGAEAKAALEILRRLRMGRNVCLFAEGNTCFDGLTGPIRRGTGQLARASGANLITFRITGGYLSAPRWGYGLRRGESAGELVRVYTAQALQGMDQQQVSDRMAQDLFVDAMALQREHPIRYRSRRAAHGLPNALYLCPQCQCFDSFHAKGAQFGCRRCGLSMRYSATGFLLGDAPFDTVAGWLRWQREELERLMASDPGFSLQDEGQQLRQVGEDHRVTSLAKGTLSMNRQALSLGQISFPLAQLAGFAIYRKDRLVFTSREGSHYEIVTTVPRSALKYRDFYQIIHDKG